MIPGEIFTTNKEIIINQDKLPTIVNVSNLGDRPIQVGSHFHFFEVNKFLYFDRKSSFGKRLNIPSGTAIRFEPGEIKKIELVEFSGHKRVFGFNDLVNSNLNEDTLLDAMNKMNANNFGDSGNKL